MRRILVTDASVVVDLLGRYAFLLGYPFHTVSRPDVI